jgi:NAD(P)-dependent dehydrogenase (short-subunit alcohol dehydrogenase family)
MGIDLFKYDGKRALVIGGATGMGAATAQRVAELGGEVMVMDVAEITYPVKQAIQVDLTQQASVDEALGQIEGEIHAVFACAGVADGTPNLMTINFISQRHLIERLLERGALSPRAAIAMISSVAGLGWQRELETIGAFLATPDWASAAEWIDAHPDKDNYSFSKQSMNAYVARQAFPLLKRGLRINAIAPGPTDTPLAQANADLWLAYAADYNQSAGVETLTPDQMANVLVFLCSDAASGMTGETFLVDQGQVNATMSGGYAPEGGPSARAPKRSIGGRCDG